MDKKNIAELQNEVVEEFALFDDRMQKYEHIIELGKDLDELPEHLKVDKALVKGCQSRVWLHASEHDGKINFEADSDAFIVRGLVSILLRIFDHQPIEDVVHSELTFIQKIGLQEMLSPTRANGLASMIKQMKLFAVALQAQNA